MTEIPTAEFALESIASPLLDRARAHLERQVTIHLVSGADYDGRLTDVSEDGVLTVADGDDVYEIDSDKVAAIESQRPR